jgi:type II secretory pathway predicted ATPase ExeA
MYENFYGFLKKPFSISPDPDFFYWNDNYKEAYALMKYCILDGKGILCITGEVGTGKTMLLNKLLDSLDDKVKAIVVPFPKLPFNELVGFIMAELGMKDISNLISENLKSLSRRLLQESTMERSVVLLIDEAQTLDGLMLENLRLLSNIETRQKKLLQIVLLGQPELNDQLELPEHRPIRQRISVRFKLKPLDDEEIPRYIAHRIKVAGFQGGLTFFREGAVKAITAYSRGTPRIINSLCENAFLIGFASNKRYIDEQGVHEAAADLMLSRTTTRTETRQTGERHPIRSAKLEARKGRRGLYMGMTFCLTAVAGAAALLYLNIFNLKGFTSAMTIGRENAPRIEPTMGYLPRMEDSSSPPPSPSVEPSRVEGEKLADAVVIKAQETISAIAVATYGTSHNYVLGLIHMANPRIEYLDIVQAGEKIVLPYLRAESMVFKNNDGTYSIYVAATKYAKLAENWKKQLKQYGIDANIVPVKINKKLSVYRLQGDNFRTISAATEKLKDIVPLQLMTKSMEEKNE